jgi:hypothetical protein
VFYGGFLYVIGGYNGLSALAECERYDTLHNHWQPIPPLPSASYQHAAIVCGYTRRIYTLGGRNSTGYLDLIQEFELESQTWKLLEVKLPSKSDEIPCFRVRNQALITSSKAVLFTPSVQSPTPSLTSSQSPTSQAATDLVTSPKGLFTTL